MHQARARRRPSGRRRFEQVISPWHSYNRLDTITPTVHLGSDHVGAVAPRCCRRYTRGITRSQASEVISISELAEALAPSTWQPIRNVCVVAALPSQGVRRFRTGDVKSRSDDLV